MGTFSEADNSQEQWRAIDGHPGYEVSNIGNVRRSDLFDPHGRLAYPATAVTQNQSRGPEGGRYLEVSLRKVDATDRRDRARPKVHHLVAAAFIGPRPQGLVICHNDGNRNNNRVENLRYDTQAANIADMHRHRGGHHNTLKTTCKYGHDITDPDNIYPNGNGRKCRTCARANAARQWEARKAAKSAS
jgi:hypothetical protein